MARQWDDDQLRAAIATSTSYRMAARSLGAVEARRAVKERARRLGLDVSHFKRWEQPVGWTDDELRAAVHRSRSIAQVLKLLDLRPAGGNYVHVRRRIEELAIDTSHFRGQAWNSGLSFRPSPPISLAALLVANRPTGTHRLKLRLFREGIKPARCELCGWAQVAADGRLPLELDHINGDRNDNRIENLRILCPNCHSLQPTHRGLNKRSRRL